MSKTSTVVVKGGSFFGAMTLLLTGLFVAGKIFGFITWSWWMVFLPLLIYVGFIFVPLAIIAVVMGSVLALAVVGLILFVLFLLGRTLYNEARRKIQNYRERKAASQIS